MILPRENLGTVPSDLEIDGRLLESHDCLAALVLIRKIHGHFVTTIIRARCSSEAILRIMQIVQEILVHGLGPGCIVS